MNDLRSLLPPLVIGCSVLLVSPGVAAQPAEISSRPAPDRDYRLFVGLNVEVSQDENYAPIEGYGSNQVLTDLSPNPISLRNVDDVRFTYRAKLSRTPLTVENIHAEQVASTASAVRDAMRNQQALQAFQSLRINQIQAAMGEANTIAEDDNGDETPASGDAFNDLNRELTNFSEIASKMTDTGALTDDVDQRKVDGEPTALLITAKISSPVRITDAYLVGVARISTKESVSSDVLFFDRVPVIDQKPRRIRVIKEGLPVEFEVKDVKIHVYRNGQEFVTDHSDKQFALTREEAREYLALERSGSHRGESLPPEPAWALVPPVMLAHDRPADFDYPLTVNVDASGRVTAIDDTTIAPPAIKAAVEDLFFLPALENGIPVAGVAKVNLKDFFR
jgi:hypothetical protein